jgi:twinkle protein
MDARPFRHGQIGLYSLADLPQRPPLSSVAYGSGWWELDELFKFYPGQLLIVSGISSHGKSTFLMNVLLKLAGNRDTRSFMYVPENEDELRETMRRIWTGPDNQFRRIARENIFVQSSLPEDNYDDPPRTMSWVLDQATITVLRDQVGIVLIDPWNQLDRAKPKDQLMTDYIGECLTYAKAYARQANVTVIIVAHPTKAVTENGGRIPNLADIDGSMNWFNKCDNGLVVWRDITKKGVAMVISQKVRQIGAGARGECDFTVDRETGIFTPMYGAVRLL